MSKPFGIHPQNNKIFEYNGKPTVLLCATEHYGSVMNRPFDYEAYLRYCHETGQNYTRLFLLFRELQTPVNPHSTCKPESTDYISPYVRSGPGSSADGLPKYNLDMWNPEFFERLHDFMAIAAKCNVIVEVTLFSNNYTNDLFALIPFGKNANINDVGCESFQTFMTDKDSLVYKYQLKYVEKIVSELNQYDNFFFEICNEPVSFTPELALADEINGWQQNLIDYIRKLESGMPKTHLIAVTECWVFNEQKKTEAGTDKTFRQLTADIANVHPLENIVYNGKSYDIGLFMSKQLCLEELKGYCMDTWSEGKPLNIDEDNIASRFMDYEGWTIHRKRVWTALFSGAHYDYIDFSIGIHCPEGTPESQKHLHEWYKAIRGYMVAVDILECKPLEDIIAGCPKEVLCSVFGKPGKQYNIYIADKRELDDNACGEIISGEILLNLAEGAYNIKYFSPEKGIAISEESALGSPVKLSLPEFRHDLVIQLNKV
jgi:hypothetical protein